MNELSRDFAGISSTTSLNNRARPGQNNFNVLRFTAASLVILSHGFELPTGLAVRDWAYAVTGKAFSWYAVNLFFVISGYLIFVSWRRNPSVKFFCWSRFLRIVPGLFVMIFVSVAILGAAFSDLTFPKFATDAQTIRYIAGCLSIVFVKYDLPGVFSTNPLQAVNGSLWTLRYEIFCYSAVAVAGCIGLWKLPRVRVAVILIGLIATSIVLISIDLIWVDLRDSNHRVGMLYEVSRLGMCFLLGGLYADIEEKVRLRLVFLFGLLLLTLAAIGTPVFAPVANIATAYAAIWFALVPNGNWIKWTRSAPDYSYGIYIYAFPVQQALISLVPGISPIGAIVGGLFSTLLFAGLSWHLVEKPALSLKRIGRRYARSGTASAAL
jgi:peptidoglycan/LPS O-acetylase OafA/YrhL